MLCTQKVHLFLTVLLPDTACPQVGINMELAGQKEMRKVEKHERKVAHTRWKWKQLEVNAQNCVQSIRLVEGLCSIMRETHKSSKSSVLLLTSLTLVDNELELLYLRKVATHSVDSVICETYRQTTAT